MKIDSVVESFFYTLLTILATLLLNGCGSYELAKTKMKQDWSGNIETDWTVDQKIDWDADQRLANFYWPYAAMATNVYRSRGETNSYVASAIASPWLRDEFEDRNVETSIKRKYADLKISEAEDLYRTRIVSLCKSEPALNLQYCEEVIQMCGREAEERLWRSQVLRTTCNQTFLLCFENQFKRNSKPCAMLVASDIIKPEMLDKNSPHYRKFPKELIDLVNSNTHRRISGIQEDEGTDDTGFSFSTEGVTQLRKSRNLLDEAAVPIKEMGDSVNRFISDEPQSEKDCNYAFGSEPKVPVHTLEKEGWHPAPEFHKETQATGWKIFIPELAIDVWRQTKRNEDAAPVVEYAFVFRGTTGGGGIWSNLRGLAVMFQPFVWDQYRQARRATVALINQIDRLHKLSDQIHERPLTASTKILYTTVGHSLGGGLATYIHLREPRITRSVTFNASPINGTSTLGLEKRAGVTANSLLSARQQESSVPPADIYQLNELGEPLSSAFPCETGPLWGQEKGPHLQCDRANLSSGRFFDQHNMAQLACKLYARRQKLPSTDVFINH